MTATLVLADNGDDTGAVATVAGTGGGDTNNVYISQVKTLQVNSSPWTLGGTRTGNGTVALDLDVGYYWAYLSGATILPPTYFVVSDGLQAFHYRCMLAIQAALRGLVLAGVDNSSIIVRKLPLDRYLNSEEAFAKFGGIKLPAILVCPIRERPEPRGGPIGLNEYIYGVSVTNIRIDNKDPTLVANLPEMLLQRQQGENRFLDNYLATIPQANETWVEALDLPNFSAWRRDLLVDSYVVRIRCWISRPN